MSFLSAAATGVQTLGGLSGLFGKKDKTMSPHDQIVSQARGARDAADQYGFNPLTMLQYGSHAGFQQMGGGVSPLSSLQDIAEGLQELSPEARLERENKRKADQLNLDLAKIKLDQARSGVVFAPTSVGGGSPLGREAVTVMQGGAAERGSNAALSSDRIPVGPARRDRYGYDIGGDNDPVLKANKDGVPGFRLFGIPFVGSGNTSNGQTFEDAGGEVVSAVGGGAGVIDAVSTTIGRALDHKEAERLKAAGVPVHQVDGKYYALEPSKPKAPKPYTFGNYHTTRHAGPLVRFH
jgi:hypothetical protein